MSSCLSLIIALVLMTFYLVSLPLVFFFFLFIEATMLGIKAVNSVYSLPLLDM